MTYSSYPLMMSIRFILNNLNQMSPCYFFAWWPGLLTSPIYRKFLIPLFIELSCLIKRGSGKSLPYASINKNTSSYLIEDIKTILDSLNRKSILYGGSWGSTLALLFSERYPSYVYSLVLRGFFYVVQMILNGFIKKGLIQFIPIF